MVKLGEYKELTEHKPIRLAKIPQKAYIPLVQHFGKPCDNILVKPGDLVKTGQIIATSKDGLFSPIHSSISGRVASITDWLHPTLGKAKAIVIESDGKDEKDFGPQRTKEVVEQLSTHSTSCFDFAQHPSKHPEHVEGLRVDTERSALGGPSNVSIKDLKEIIFNAGIVGLGGAGFPTHIKLSPPKPVNTLILNGAECEPYLTNDCRLMSEYADEIIAGAKIVLKILGINKCIVAIEENKLEAINIFRKKLSENFSLKILKACYPQGGEKQLIKSTLNKEVPSGGLPYDVGAVVQNVGTVYAIYEAVYKNKPLYERVITITGSCVQDPGNFLVRLGTTIKDLASECGGLKEEPAKIVFGGPMMGIAQSSQDTPVIKTTSGIIFFSQKEIIKKESRVCCRCARCIDACPARIMPAILGMAAEKERWDIAKEYDIYDCIECGLCSYICPAKRDLVQLIKYAKLRAKAK